MTNNLTKGQLEALIDTRVDDLVQSVLRPSYHRKTNFAFEVIDEGIKVGNSWNEAWIVIRVGAIYMRLSGRMQEAFSSNTECTHLDWERVMPEPSIEYVPYKEQSK